MMVDGMRLTDEQGKGSEQRYKGAFDCVRKVIKEEGIGRFYRGFGTYYVRIAPHAMLTVRHPPTSYSLILDNC